MFEVLRRYLIRVISASLESIGKHRFAFPKTMRQSERVKLKFNKVAEVGFLVVYKRRPSLLQRIDTPTPKLR